MVYVHATWTRLQLLLCSIIATIAVVIESTDPQCNFHVDSTDPRHGLVRAGNDYSCAPLDRESDTLDDCIAACCADAGKCISFSWNAPWTLNGSRIVYCAAMLLANNMC